MAYTKTVERIMPTANKIGFKLVIMNGEETIFERDYWEEFSPGSGLASDVEAKLQERMQTDIDHYKAMLALYNNASYETARGRVETALEL